MKRITSRLPLCLMLLMIATTTAHASEARQSGTGATKITLQGRDAAAALANVLVGSGVEGIDAPDASATAGGNIYWVKTRDKIDHLGNRHVFYSQTYAPLTATGPANPSPADLGVQLDGAAVGLHYHNGDVRFVFGAEFEDVVDVSAPMIGQAINAYEVARARVAERPGFSPADPQLLSPQDLERDLSRVRLILRSAGDGTTFRYVWRVPIRDDVGLLYHASLDAETAELLSLRSSAVFDKCAPDEGEDEESADGISQRGSTRDIWATESSTRGEDYTHEAHKKSAGSNPDIELHYRPGDPSDHCDYNGAQETRRYALMPIKTISGTPTYDDYTTPDEIPGKAAADAMYFTYLTMSTFHDYGRNGWDGGGGTARAVVTVNADFMNCPGGWIDRSFFNHNTVTWLPNDAVVHCPVVDQSYAEAAALDIVAHEWGHGVLFSDVGWEEAGVEEIYHEGWADIIGYIVEWANQSAGTDPEEADWQFGEDRGEWHRQVFNYGYRSCVFSEEYECESFHAADPEESSEEHALGNRLPVAFRLMVVGGDNTICDEYPSLDGCGVGVPGIGVNMASDILFYTVQYLLMDSAGFGWDDFGTAAKTAAFYLYESCPNYWAILPQRSAYEAFEAIGYFPDDEIITCD